MDRESVEKMISEYGSGSPEFKARRLELNHRENGVVYEPDTTDDSSIDVFINDIDLYVDNRQNVKFEVDDWGLVVRLYYEHYYIGAVVKSWEDLKNFDINGGY